MHALVCICLYILLGDTDGRRILKRVIEALTRAGEFDRKMLEKSVAMFEVRLSFQFVVHNADQPPCFQDFLQYMNHVGLCTEEIGPAGEGLVFLPSSVLF